MSGERAKYDREYYRRHPREEILAQIAAYRKTPKGREVAQRAVRKYRASAKGRESVKAWRQGETYKTYMATTAVKERRKRAALKPERQAATRWAIDKRVFGLYPGEREEMELAQGGVCAICQKPPGRVRLHVDHHHDCQGTDLRGSIRGLLCSACNLSHFGEDQGLIFRALAYWSAHLERCSARANAA